MEKINRKTQIIVLISFFVLLVVVMIVLYPFLPAQIPMQYSLTGSVNRYADKLVAVLTAVSVNGALSLYTIFTSQDKIPTKNFIVCIGLTIISIIAISASLFIQ